MTIVDWEVDPSDDEAGVMAQLVRHAGLADRRHLAADPREPSTCNPSGTPSGRACPVFARPGDEPS
jgi:hypothetical protein